MSSVKHKKTEQLQQLIQKELNYQIQYEKIGNYVEAQKYRLAVEKSKKDLQARLLYEMNQNHINQLKQLQLSYQLEMSSLKQYWNQKMKQFKQKVESHEKEMKDRHKREQTSLRENLSLNLPSKVKQSNQLLNLRKMEEYMKRQKNYVQAHYVQNKINQLEKEQTEAWNISRNQKISNAIAQLSIKQAAQLLNWKNRNQEEAEDFAKQRHMAEVGCTHKYETNQKDFKSKHEREFLSFKGEFKTVGGSQSSPIGSKTKFT